MKNVALTIAAVGALIATPVLAADMATKAPPRVVAAPVPFSWTGFYVGLNGGYAQNRIETVGQGLPFVGTSASPTSQDFNTSGGFGGGQLGLNYQWQSIVFGAEADAAIPL
jgi:outer membrane immunogenic protein